MSVQLVQHKSRSFDISLIFPATENNLSWAFTAENDGEIYDVELNNIASYTINGVPTSITTASPYDIIDENSYTVGVAKTNNGQVASIVLKTRRAVNKSISISVPDFGQFDGRYLYVLLNNNTVKKIDTELLLPSKYLGDGLFDIDPVVSTISLPALPNGATYTGIQFVKVNNEAKIFIVGGEANSYKWYASYIRCSDDSIFDLAMTNANSYTQISNSNLIYNSPRNILYDFISEILYIKSTEGINGTSVIQLRLVSNESTNLVYSRFADRFMSQTITSQYQLDPVVQQFIGVGDTSLSEERNYNYKALQNNGNVWGYRYDTGHRLCTGDSFGLLNYFNSFGKIVGGVNFGFIRVFWCSQIRGFYLQNAAFMTHINNYAIVNWATSTTKLRATDKNLASPNNYIFNLLSSNYNKLFFGFSASSTGVLANRMLLFKESEANADYAYIDFPETILGAANTQLII